MRKWSLLCEAETVSSYFGGFSATFALGMLCPCDFASLCDPLLVELFARAGTAGFWTSYLKTNDFRGEGVVD